MRITSCLLKGQVLDVLKNVHKGVSPSKIQKCAENSLSYISSTPFNVLIHKELLEKIKNSPSFQMALNPGLNDGILRLKYCPKTGKFE